jgi:poly(beta-D-mannuronate) lyase
MITRGLLLAVAYALTSLACAAHAGDCPSEPPVARVESAKFYSDSHGAVLDKDKVEERNRAILPLRNFVSDVSARIDGADRAGQECAQQMMLAWAQANALLEEPSDMAGQRDRQIFTISLNIIALKLQAAGLGIEPLLGWLGQVNHAVIDYFAKRNKLAAATHRPEAGWAPVDNLYVWSGVDAASFAVLDHDRVARQYEDEVWSAEIKAIRPDGYVESELRRAGRALSYHVYDLSALLTLHAFRESLGEALTAQERAAIDRLVDRVGAALCDPAAMATAAGGFPQEKPVASSVGTGFALEPQFLSQQIRSFLAGIPTTDPLFGGNLARTADILANRRR